VVARASIGPGLSPNHAVWVDPAGPYMPSAPLAGEIAADVAVVGAGVTGLSTAWHLGQLDSSVEVAVVEW